jgi:RNA recognition motif-containing protein
VAQVEDSTVVMDKSTGRSKGFGFVTFVAVASCQKALAEPQREIEVGPFPFVFQF